MNTSVSMPAVAVTDVNNLFGTYELSDTLAKAGVQPIVGCLVSVELEDAPAVHVMGVRKKPPAMALLVQNDTGYRNLTKLLSTAFLGAEPGDWPHVTTAELAGHAEGLIALTGGPGGPVNKLLVEGQVQAADALVETIVSSPAFLNKRIIDSREESQTRKGEY